MTNTNALSVSVSVNSDTLNVKRLTSEVGSGWLCEVELQLPGHLGTRTYHVANMETRKCSVTSGYCASASEALARVKAQIDDAGNQVSWQDAGITQAPANQANEAEMVTAARNMEGVHYRDGGVCERTLAAALAAGIHSPEWAAASAYIEAGWLHC